MTVATLPAERIGRMPVQLVAELRVGEQVAIQRIADKAAQLAFCRQEIGRAAERRDRGAVYRFSDLQSALIESIESEARAAVALLRDNTPAYTGERPL